MISKLQIGFALNPKIARCLPLSGIGSEFFGLASTFFSRCGRLSRTPAVRARGRSKPGLL